MRTAVVTLVHGRHRHLVRQQESLAAGTTQPSTYVVVAMDDVDIRDRLEVDPAPQVVDLPADPLGLPLAMARNRGAERAFAAGAETVVMLDVDCLAGPELVAGYAAAVATDPAVVWSGPVTYLPPTTDGYPLTDLASMDRPHLARPAPAPGVLLSGGLPDLFWSLSFAVHRTAWERLGGFCEEYVGYGAEDTDFGHHVLATGLGLGWAGTPRAYHQHHPSSDPPVEHLDDILRNGRIFNVRWGRWPMEGWLTEFEERGLIVRDGDGNWLRRPGRASG